MNRNRINKDEADTEVGLGSIKKLLEAHVVLHNSVMP
jgi:hypothetical protein